MYFDKVNCSTYCFISSFIWKAKAKKKVRTCVLRTYTFYLNCVNNCFLKASGFWTSNRITRPVTIKSLSS